MRLPQQFLPALRFADLPVAGDEWPPAAAARADPRDPPQRQQGASRGLAVLDDFRPGAASSLSRQHLLAPLSAPSACSRLSPYLAQGSLGLREVVQATRTAIACTPPGSSASARACLPS